MRSMYTRNPDYRIKNRREWNINYMNRFVHNNSQLIVYDDGSFAVYPVENEDVNQRYVTGYPNFEVNLSGGKQIMLNKAGFQLVDLRETGQIVFLTYRCDQRKLQVEVTIDFSKGRNVYTQKNRITNLGDDTIRLTRFSSAVVDTVGVSSDTQKWFEKNLRFHICHNKWQGEGQWKSYTAQELGLYPATTHEWERAVYRLQSTGSWSTANFYPLILVEDPDSELCWFMELEGSHHWMMKLAAYGGYEKTRLTIEATGCEEANGNWYYDLKAGESYTTERAFFGVVHGGFEECVSELNDFKRADTIGICQRVTPPVVFNDYMDCVWGRQEPELLLPLIEEAARVGCEIFCIDGGWYENRKGSGLGDWEAKKQNFSKISIEEVIQVISDHGMIPGIWFEWEACSDTADGFSLEDDCILKRHDSAVGETRCFYNFKSRKVREYLKDRVRHFYQAGVRYIKNDYNQSLGVGCTNNYNGESPAQGLIENCNAFYEFIDEIYTEFPGLIIENCGSGALRSDNKTLRYFSLQSVSDQELYQNNPSIVMGSLAQYPPEKAAIWSYPYPVMLPEVRTFQISDEYRARMADGRQTAFNMITAMMGDLYLSGRIDLCDEFNSGLIKSAIALYKKNRNDIPVSRPIYPLGMHGINQKEVAALGLLAKDKLMLAVWNLTENDQDIAIDLTKWILAGSAITDVYAHTAVNAAIDNGVLSCHLESNAAVYLGIDL